MNDEVFRKMNERLEEYEQLLNQMVEESTNIGVVVSGPIEEGRKKFYRVRVKGDDHVLVSAVNEKLEPDVEVICTTNFIAKVVPKKLVTLKEVQPFKHIGWDEVGGLKSQIEEIRRQVEGPITHAKMFREFGVEPSKGALLYGPPGCGKTLVSKVIASMIIDSNKGSSDAFVYIKGPEILHGLVGSTEERVRNIFTEGRRYTKRTGSRSVVFIDEAEALLSMRGSGISSDMNMTVVPQFLSEMDGFDENSPFVLLATNLPKALDPAITREGRIDLKIEIKRPSKDDAVEIFTIHLKKKKLIDDISKLSRDSAEHLYSTGAPVAGSMIAAICNAAAMEALYRFSTSKVDKGIKAQDMVKSIDKIIQTQI